MVNMGENQQKHIIVIPPIIPGAGKSRDPTALSLYSVYQTHLQILGIMISWGNHVRQMGVIIFNNH